MIHMAGAGCALLDFIHADVDFSSPAFSALRSRRPGDGGLEPGKLVFAEDFERFAGADITVALAALVRGAAPDACNVGGPGIVAMIHAAQLLHAGGGARFSVDFTGARGADSNGGLLGSMVAPCGLDGLTLVPKEGRTAFTLVLSDPRHDGGRGERCFINEIGAAGRLGAEDLPASLFDADIAVFGGTGLTPALHDALGPLLLRCRSAGTLTIVNTVYDFRNERRDPVGRWPLGSDEGTYASVDLLVADLEEALRLSGASDASGALAFFGSRGVGAAVVTSGTRDIAVAAFGKGRFAPMPERRYPVSAAVMAELAAHPERRGDTTGCGDNFAGGLVASAAMQLEAGAGPIDLGEALAWAVASGGFACFHVGGVFTEDRPGHKKSLIEPRVAAWRSQVGLS